MSKFPICKHCGFAISPGTIESEPWVHADRSVYCNTDDEASKDLRAIPVIEETTVVHKFVLPLDMKWSPKEDITTYELAMCLPYLIRLHAVMPYEIDMYDITDNYLRHFDITNPNIRD